MASLETAIELACSAHFGQVDKAGEPYILHPLRVMLAQESDAARMVGVLHDVVEDSAYTLDDLEHHGFGGDIRAAVDALTRRDGEDYMRHYLWRVKGNKIAAKVKIADLRDNLRGQYDTPEKIRRREKYCGALAYLEWGI